MITDFNQLDLRVDKGALWENFLVSERRKQNIYKDTFAKMYFWRTKQQQEVDFVEENSGKIIGYEFKWNKTIVKVPSAWKNNYPDAQFVLVNQKNYLDFITGKI